MLNALESRLLSLKITSKELQSVRKKSYIPVLYKAKELFDRSMGKPVNGEDLKFISPWRIIYEVSVDLFFNEKKYYDFDLKL